METLSVAALMCLALNIYYEARGEPVAGQLAVAEVTLNRARLSGKDICEIVYAPAQFSWTIEPVGPPVEPDALGVAARIALSAVSQPTNLTDGATNFHATWLKPPSWARRMEQTVTIGGHVFYRDEAWYNRSPNRR